MIMQKVQTDAQIDEIIKDLDKTFSKVNETMNWKRKFKELEEKFSQETETLKNTKQKLLKDIINQKSNKHASLTEKTMQNKEFHEWETAIQI